METIRMKAPEGATSCSHNGIIYEVEQGFVYVIHAAVEALKSFGYHIAPDQAAEAEKLKQADAEAKSKAEAELKVRQEALEAAIAAAPAAIFDGKKDEAGNPWTVERCADSICGFFGGLADYATVTDRITAGVKTLQDAADAQAKADAEAKAQADAEAKSKAEADAKADSDKAAGKGKKGE